LIRDEIQTKKNKECQFKEFIKECDTTLLEEFQLIETEKINEEVELYRNFDPKTSYVTTLLDELPKLRINDDENPKYLANSHNQYGLTFLNPTKSYDINNFSQIEKNGHLSFSRF
jgi:hypothetical protein